MAQIKSKGKFDIFFKLINKILKENNLRKIFDE